MDFEEWETFYNSIIQDFDYDKEKDRLAASILSEKITQRETDLSSLEQLKGKEVVVTGPFIQEFDQERFDTIISAGSAVEQLTDIDIKPDIMVTDLDGDIDLQMRLNKEGIPIVVHAHGDNIALIKKHISDFTGPLIPTCQCEPLENVYNFGGFTDGDRAAFMAEHFGAEKITLHGWDFETPWAKGDESRIKVKIKKLRWAEHLIGLLETPVEQVR
ncbi:MAG: 6-hydroxymethylpterin diphosphokinase MptE-like protein [Thermoplasmata archaeon]